MSKRIYQVGEPCDYCQTPTVEGKFGAYCKKCYIEYKNKKEALQPATNGYHPQTAQSPIQAPIVQPTASGERTERIIELLTSIDSKLEAIHDKLPLYADVDGKPERVTF